LMHPRSQMKADMSDKKQQSSPEHSKALARV
jgi:hypothetical protein